MSSDEPPGTVDLKTELCSTSESLIVTFTSKFGAFSKVYGCIAPNDFLGEGDRTIAEANTSEFLSVS